MRLDVQRVLAGLSILLALGVGAIATALVL